MKTLLIISLLVGSSTLNATTSPMGTIKSLPQESQLNDASEFLARLKDQRLRNFLEGATWTLIHDYSDFKHIEEVLSHVEKFLEALGEHEKGNDIPLSQNGGVKGFKDKLAGWLEDNDQAVRSYAAIMLGVTGDHRYAPQLAALIKSRKAPATHFDRYDRGRAAIALGLVKAKEYAPLLVTLLKSPNKSTRSGAAIGLALLGAKDQAKAIARLQNDQDESVRDSAKEALEILENFKTASQTLTFTEANRNDAVRNKDYSHAVFSFSVGAHRYSVSGSGELTRTAQKNTRRAITLDLPRPPRGISKVRYRVYQGDLIINYNFLLDARIQQGDKFIEGEVEQGRVSRLDGRTLKMRWVVMVGRSDPPGEPVIVDDSLYFSSAGSIGEADVNSGLYLWRHENLTQKDGKPLYAFKAPRVKGEYVFFEEADKGLARPTYTVQVRRRTGEIITVNYKDQ